MLDGVIGRRAVCALPNPEQGGARVPGVRLALRRRSRRDSEREVRRHRTPAPPETTARWKKIRGVRLRVGEDTAAQGVACEPLHDLCGQGVENRLAGVQPDAGRVRGGPPDAQALTRRRRVAFECREQLVESARSSGGEGEEVVDIGADLQVEQRGALLDEPRT